MIANTNQCASAPARLSRYSAWPRTGCRPCCRNGNSGSHQEGQIDDVCQTTIPAHEASAADVRGRGDAGPRRPGGQRRGTPSRAATQEPCDIYAVGRYPVRGRAQHHPRAVRRVQRAAVPGQARLGQRHPGHRPAQRGRLRQRRRAGLVLRGHQLRHHRSSTTSPAAATTSPRRPAAAPRAAPTASPTRPRRRSPSAATRRTASTSPRAPATATTTPTASPPATSPRACTRSSTARTTTAAAASTTATPRRTATTTATAPWRPSTSATSRSGATAPATARGSWPTWRTACSPATASTQRQRPDHQLPVHHRHHQGRPEPVGHPRRQRPVRRPVHLLQRGTAHLRLQPDEEAGRDHPRHRRRQQQGRATAPSTRAS